MSGLTKQCTKCGRRRPRSKFTAHPGTKDGLGSWCNVCRYEQLKYYRKHGPKIRVPRTECRIRGCKKPPGRGRSLCFMHITRFKRHGSFHKPPGRKYVRLDYETWRDRKSQAHTRRMRLLRNARFEPYERHAVFERDHWVCWICGKKINRRRKGRESLAPSIDHVIPLSRGGDDTLSNVRAAHFGCNSGYYRSEWWSKEVIKEACLG